MQHQALEQDPNDTVTQLHQPTQHYVYQAIWLSDVHLGSVDCKAEYLLHFLNQSQCEYLYLVGDIIDIWALKKRIFWPSSHQAVVQKILSIAATSTQVYFIPGNHDEVLKQYVGKHFSDIKLVQSHIHHSLNGMRCLMVHGDQFDSQVCVGKGYAKLGDHLYDVLLWLNRALHRARSMFGFPYWSLASYIKLRVGKAQQAIERYKHAVLAHAQQQQVDMVICGHIHQPSLSKETLNHSESQTETIIYANDGDWVENCSIIAETETGDMALLKWNDSLLTMQTITHISTSPHNGENSPLPTEKQKSSNGSQHVA